MLYFEDFIEGVEGLPEEVKQKLTDIRILDLKARNIDDKLPNQRDGFFKRMENNSFSSKEERLIAQQTLLNDNDELFKLSEQKEEVAKMLYEKIDKCCSKMQGELEKFKMELEADHPGVTDKIERDVLYAMTSGNGSLSRGERKRNRGRGIARSINTGLSGLHTSSSTSHPSNASGDVCDGSNVNASLYMNSSDSMDANRRLTLKIPQGSSSHHLERKRNRPFWDSPRTPGNDGHSNRISSSTASNGVGNPQQYSTPTHESDHVFESPNADSGSYQRLPSTGRRSIMNEYESYDGHDNQPGMFTVEDATNGNHSDSQFHELSPAHSGSLLDSYHHDAWVDGIISPNPHAPLPTSARPQRTTSMGVGRKKEPLHSSGHLYVGDTGGASSSSILNEEAEEDEQVFCVCRQVSFGDMVACDSPTCPYEWFHFTCVNLTTAPRGKWYCPNCRTRYQNIPPVCPPTTADLSMNRKRYKRR